MQSFAPGEPVFSKGDEGTHFYVILRGSVSVHISADLSSAVNFVEEGQCFGELALINDEKRTATILSRENCVILLVSKDNYRQILQRQQVRMTKEKVACFAELPHFSTDEPYKLQGLVMSSKLVKVPANFVICKQGETVSFLYIVQKGACRIIKEVRCADPPMVRPGDSVTADRTFERNTCFLEAERLGRFGFFGENGLLVNRGGARASFKGALCYPASLVSTVASEILAVRITDFLRFTDRANIDGIVQFSKTRSERLGDKVLSQQLLNQIKWEQDKTALLDSLAVPRYKRCNEQRKAEQRLLRKPVPPTQRASGAKPAAEPASHSPRARRSSLDVVFFDKLLS
jgi:CRP-like cAMP-binding protein